MATDLKNLSEYNVEEISDLSKAKIGVIVSQWNEEITQAMYNGCRKTLLSLGIKKKNILHVDVPGSYELPSAAKMLIESKKMDSIICLGCIIQGETRHFEFISQAVANGIIELNIRYPIPVVFGVLTTNDIVQARERAGGKHGNKGVEAAVTAVKMMVVRKKLVR